MDIKIKYIESPCFKGMQPSFRKKKSTRKATLQQQPVVAPFFLIDLRKQTVTET